MAPEQWRMAALDERTDIWAAGVVYLEMLRGSPPFAGVDPSRLFASILSDLATLPPSSPLGMPRIGDRLIESMMSRDPKRRPGSAVELLLGLDSVQHAIQHRPVAEGDGTCALVCGQHDAGVVAPDVGFP